MLNMLLELLNNRTWDKALAAKHPKLKIKHIKIIPLWRLLLVMHELLWDPQLWSIPKLKI